MIEVPLILDKPSSYIQYRLDAVHLVRRSSRPYVVGIIILWYDEAVHELNCDSCSVMLVELIWFDAVGNNTTKLDDWHGRSMTALDKKKVPRFRTDADVETGPSGKLKQRHRHDEGITRNTIPHEFCFCTILFQVVRCHPSRDCIYTLQCSGRQGCAVILLTRSI